MEQVGNYCSYVFLVLAIAVFVLASLRFFAAFRSWLSAPERLVTESVACPHRQEAAVITFVERRRIRRVQSCSLLDVGERCNELCARLSN